MGKKIILLYFPFFFLEKVEIVVAERPPINIFSSEKYFKKM